MSIALATAAMLPRLSQDDQVLYAELARRGYDAEAVIWDDAADWSRYDVVVVRSIWDYHLKYARFLAWLSALDASGARIHNPTSMLRANADKRYMVGLEQKGVRITPTRVVARAEDRNLADVLAETGWRHAVVKPTVSSTGYETWFVDAPCARADEQRFAAQKSSMDVLVQEFVSGVYAGEQSFVFIDGAYTHSFLKRAAADEFRVHVEHGGTVEAVEPAPSQIEWAQSVVTTLGEQPWTYARVDAVRGEEGLVLMEFELLDPELFFQYSPLAIERFIQAIVRD
jgi:glutathione synthase/RimK-type ligase-like ATP-grasp enzyme